MFVPVATPLRKWDRDFGDIMPKTVTRTFVSDAIKTGMEACANNFAKLVQATIARVHVPSVSVRKLPDPLLSCLLNLTASSRTTRPPSGLWRSLRCRRHQPPPPPRKNKGQTTGDSLQEAVAPPAKTAAATGVRCRAGPAGRVVAALPVAKPRVEAAVAAAVVVVMVGVARPGVMSAAVVTRRRPHPAPAAPARATGFGRVWRDRLDMG